MALLDFIKNRGEQRPAAEQQSQQQKPETAKQMYTQKDADDRAALKPVDSLPAKQREGVEQIRAEFEKSTARAQSNMPAPTPEPNDGATSPEAQRQNMTSQDKAAPQLSPTSMQAGSTSSEKETPSPTVEQASQPEQKQAPDTTPDLTPNPTPRGRGGWER